MAINPVPVPITTSIDAASSEFNITDLRTPAFQTNNCPFFQGGLTNFYRNDVELDNSDIIITTEGQLLSYQLNENNANEGFIFNGDNLVATVNAKGVEKYESYGATDCTYDGQHVRLLNFTNNKVTISSPTAPSWSVDVPGTILKCCLIKSSNQALIINQQGSAIRVYIARNNNIFFVNILNFNNWYNAAQTGELEATTYGPGFKTSRSPEIFFTIQGNTYNTSGNLYDQGTCWRIASDMTVTSFPGQLISMYKGEWYVFHKPFSNGTFGAASEWRVALNLRTVTYDQLLPKTFVMPPGMTTFIRAEVTEFRIAPGFFSMIQRYVMNSNGASLYWYEASNDDGIHQVDLSITQMAVVTPGGSESVLGSFDPGDEMSAHINMFNNRSSIYGNVKLLTNGGVPFGISWAPNNNMGTNLVGMGMLNIDKPVQVYLQSDGRGMQWDPYTIVYQDENSEWNVITISNRINKHFLRISNHVYKVNTVDTRNLLIENPSKQLILQVGSLDWNNRWNFQRNNYAMTSLIAINYFLNTAFNSSFENTSLRSLSFVGATNQFPLRGFLGITPGNNLTIRLLGAAMNSEYIDIYWTDDQNDNVSPVYKYSEERPGSIQQFPKLDQLPFPENATGILTLPTPLAATYDKTSTIAASFSFGSIYSSVNFSYNGLIYDGYLSSNLLLNNQGIFSVLGTRYSYDGQQISVLELTGNQITDVIPVSYALNYRFLGAGVFEAYFYSLFDKAFYIFKGDRQLQRVAGFENKSEIFMSAFSSYENQLYMITTEEILIWRNGVLYNLPNPYGTDADIMLSKIGSFFTDYNTAKCWSIFPLNIEYGTSTDEKFYIKSQTLGADGTTIINIQKISFRLYSPTRNEVKIKLNTTSISSDSVFTEPKQITIKPAEWDKANSKMIQIVPKVGQALGIGFEIESDNRVQLLSVNYLVETEGTRQSSTSFSKGV